MSCLDILGKGGMGVVFRARHRLMDRVVALKMLSMAAIKPDTVQRFFREVKAAARLSHPNIVTAYDAGEHAGTHYLVMEYVVGRDLAAIVKEKGPLPLRQAIDYVQQAARGLEFAHKHGVVHRDVKPSNLLLDQEGVVKILDMGLARLNENLAGTPDRHGNHRDRPDLGNDRLHVAGASRGRSVRPIIVRTSTAWAARCSTC